MRVTKQEEIFCQKFSEGNRQGRSAVLAGYNEKCADTMAWRLLRKPKIIKRIEELQREKVTSAQFKSLPDVLSELSILYAGAKSIEQKRKILESFAALSGWNKDALGGHSGQYMALAVAQAEKDKIQETLGYIPKEVEGLIDSNTTKMDFSEEPFLSLREKYRKEGLELDELGTLTSFNQKGRDYIKEYNKREEASGLREEPERVNETDKKPEESGINYQSNNPPPEEVVKE